MRRIGAVASFAIALAAGASVAQAQDSLSSSASDDWSYGFAPYLWASGLKGDIATLPPAPPAQVDADFGDILENFDIGFMGLGEIHKGRFGLLVDLVYLKISHDADPSGPFFSDADMEAKTFVGTFEGSYRAVAEEHGYLDFLAGVRVWSVSTDLSLGAGLLPAQEAGHSETWVDPVIGVRGQLDLGSGFYFTALGNIGGFGAASDITWDVFGGLGYQAVDWFAPVIGYRHLEVDYEKGDFLFDVEMSGPIIGGMIRF